MKKLIAIILCCFLFVSAIPVRAAEVTPSYTSTTVLPNGITVVDEVIIQPSNARANAKDATHTKRFYNGDTLIAVITVVATFRFDGTDVSVVSKSVTQTDTYGGWSYKQDSFTSSGGTVTLEGKLKYLLLFNSTPFTMTLSCDKNGNISYT